MSAFIVLENYTDEFSELRCSESFQTFLLILRIVATSQMHPTHARKTFPCFDEPSMKAVFFITLLHPPGTVALSNGMETGVFQHKCTLYWNGRDFSAHTDSID